MGLVREDTSAIWDLAPHDIAVMNYLLDAVPERVSAVASSPLGLDNPDVSFINLFYPDGILGQIHVSWVDSNKERILRVIGNKARVVFNDLVVSLLFNTHPQIKKTYLSYGRIKSGIRLNEKDRCSKEGFS